MRIEATGLVPALAAVLSSPARAAVGEDVIGPASFAGYGALNEDLSGWGGWCVFVGSFDEFAVLEADEGDQLLASRRVLVVLDDVASERQVRSLLRAHRAVRVC